MRSMPEQSNVAQTLATLPASGSTVIRSSSTVFSESALAPSGMPLMMTSQASPESSSLSVTVVMSQYLAHFEAEHAFRKVMKSAGSASLSAAVSSS